MEFRFDVHHKRSAGSALIAVYWAIGIISLVVFTTLQFLLVEVSHTNSRGNAFRAEQLAHSAAAIAANPAISAHDPLLVSEGPEERFSALIMSEGSKLAINEILSSGHRKILERLFEIWGIDKELSNKLVDQMIDWTDSDSRITGAGKERAHYLSIGKPNLPYNLPFRSLDEVTLIEGYRQIALVKPDWRSSFTLRSSGKLDLSSAGPELIAAVVGCSLSTAEHFVEGRSGSDGLPLTEDDVTFESPEMALDLLMTFGEDRAMVLPLVSIDDPVKRIVALGTSGDITIEQIWVIKDRSTHPKILDFSTRQLKK